MDDETFYQSTRLVLKDQMVWCDGCGHGFEAYVDEDQNITQELLYQLHVHNCKEYKLFTKHIINIIQRTRSIECKQDFRFHPSESIRHGCPIQLTFKASKATLTIQSFVKAVNRNSRL